MQCGATSPVMGIALFVFKAVSAHESGFIYPDESFSVIPFSASLKKIRFLLTGARRLKVSRNNL
ncbi:hypothetical protein BS639_00515 [Rouxiella silvae]|uniref:Secreted protein n=1 Tax=Rouxiella silvae TaxID=1646373 RepID=A0ABX3U6U4_9GAMM|nr:hypothetical protein ASE93_10930 [Serratia sp. Leaf50]ORJ23222.1 hypothetical protein BS639_00515 [Rouxiella silvae]